MGLGSHSASFAGPAAVCTPCMMFVHLWDEVGEVNSVSKGLDSEAIKSTPN